MKDFLHKVLVFVIVWAGCFVGSVTAIMWTYHFADKTKLVDDRDFKIPAAKMSEDMQYRFTVMQPQGQLWGFTPDQKLDVKILQTKSTEDGVSVAVKLHSLASVPKNEKSKETQMVELSGIAKLHYELIGGQWYLADITSVNLRAAAQK